MDFRELETFIAIVEKGSISAAAASLGVSQPAVSKRVARLEKEMGASLFAKGHKHSALTSEGSVFYKAALRILDYRKKTKIQIAEISEDLYGSVTISASSIPGDYILPGLLVEFTERHPGVDVKVKVSDSQAALEDLSDKKADLAIVGTDRSLPGFSSIPFMNDELVLVVGKQHPLATRKSVSIEELSGLKLAGRSSGSGTRHIWEKLYKSRCSSSKEIALQFGHALAVVNAVASGAEGGVVSRIAAESHPDVVAVDFDPPLLRPFYMVYGLCETKAVETLVSFMIDKAEHKEG